MVKAPGVAGVKSNTSASKPSLHTSKTNSAGATATKATNVSNTAESKEQPSATNEEGSSKSESFGKNFSARLGLARCMDRRLNLFSSIAEFEQDMKKKDQEFSASVYIDKIISLYNEVIEGVPDMQETYTELGEIVAKHKGSQEAILVYSKLLLL